MTYTEVFMWARKALDHEIRMGLKRKSLESGKEGSIRNYSDCLNDCDKEIESLRAKRKELDDLEAAHDRIHTHSKK